MRDKLWPNIHLIFFYFSTSNCLLYSDPSSKAGVIAGDHFLLDKTAVHGHVMGKTELRERGFFFNRSHSVVLYNMIK